MVDATITTASCSNGMVSFVTSATFTFVIPRANADGSDKTFVFTDIAFGSSNTYKFSFSNLASLGTTTTPTIVCSYNPTASFQASDLLYITGTTALATTWTIVGTGSTDIFSVATGTSCSITTCSLRHENDAAISDTSWFTLSESGGDLTLSISTTTVTFAS